MTPACKCLKRKRQRNHQGENVCGSGARPCGYEHQHDCFRSRMAASVFEMFAFVRGWSRPSSRCLLLFEDGRVRLRDVYFCSKMVGYAELLYINDIELRLNRSEVDSRHQVP